MSGVEKEFQAVVNELEKLKTEVAALRADLAVTSALARGEIKQLKAKADNAA